MGSTCAPSYANLYLGWWQRNFVFSEALSEYTPSIMLWLCYINDVIPLSTITGIPTGQYCRIKRLCSTIEDFKVKAEKLAYKQALAMNRTSLLIPKKQESSNLIRLIGDYSRQHKEITRILAKHWHILEQDRDLKQIIADQPRITFRRTCPFIEKTKRMDTNEFELTHFMNCKTTGLVYSVRCGCDKVFVGKTRREFRRRILEHVGDVRNKHNTSVANHANELHDGNANIMKFVAVEHFEPTTRVGDIDKKLFQCEAKWIYWLNSRSPNGLNEGFTFKPLL
ncbi:hypothetical protein XELAEV_18004437mg [Xenopus laevis]|uniref:GIY-YIG domain-containing protein n=1 Tax=Xenopus laevis TaxID=8355 RepID=A0A974GZW3_XENLA|nr:hypothetical protein XELAEV_18004437mg [Xenopus laevis]